jgi:AAA domain
VTLPHVLWIGGTPGAGKTTVARALARRHGLRLHSADTQTWVHRDRALAAGHSGAIRWEAMTIDERQQIVPGEELDLWIHRERGPMLVEDVRALPHAPMIVVEGTTVPADQTPALFLDRPSARRDHPVFVHFAEAILESARRHDVPVLTVEGSVEETIAAVEEHFAAALAAGPHAEGLEERRALLREANAALVFQVRTGTARPWATETPETLTRDFLCECDDPECRVVITITAAEFERRARAGPVT